MLLLSRLLGSGCERVNFSGSTTMEHLLGSLMPVVVNGERVFQHVEGAFLSAVKANK